MNKTTIPIKGMHCRSCEILIEEKLKEISGVKEIRVSYKKQEAEFMLNAPASMDEVTDAIADAGYEVGKDEKDWISKDPREYKELGIALLVLLVLYLIFTNSSLGSIGNSTKGSPSSLLVVLIVGLTAGVSTCMAMVGGLILGMSARHSEKHPEATPAQKFRPHLFFNLGRITSYALLGGLIGLVGKAFQFSGSILGILTVGVGLVMITLGIQLTGLFPRISSAGFTLPAGLSRLLGIKKHHVKEYSHFNSLMTGALTFFLPCGFTQAMQLYAMSTGNFWRGAAIMGIFALGTAPGLLGVGGLTSFIKGSFAKKFFKFAGLLVISLAILNISNGFNLLGWKLISARKTVDASSAVKIQDGFQIVNMTQNSRGYSPNQFVVRKDVPVKWVIDSKDASSCAASIVSPKLNIKRFLRSGENVIQFTPKELGDIRFSCSMGMYTGKFTVIENDSTQQAADLAPTPQTSPPISEPSPDTQVIKTRYVATDINSTTDLSPSEFTVSVDKPVRFEVYAEIEGTGCMGTIKIPRLADAPQFLEKGKTVVFEFTPKQKGTYLITCAMGAIRGKIIVD